MKEGLFIQDLTVEVEGREVVRNVSLSIAPGEIHALMGPNGSGKSSFASAIGGHPDYRVVSGSVSLDGVDILPLKPEERGAAGLFLSFQEPPEVGGVSLRTFLSMIAPNEKRMSGGAAYLPELGLDEAFLSRFLNEGFSGGEKKKSELLQLVSRRPRIAVCDEVDSGLDLDALKSAAKLLTEQAQSGCGLLIISHAPRLFELLKPSRVHILLEGVLVASGGPDLIDNVSERGYGMFASRATIL